MKRLVVKVLLTHILVIFCQATSAAEEQTKLSSVLTPEPSKEKLNRQSRSYYDYYDYRYGIGRPYERLEYARPLYDREYARAAYDRPRCGRCDERYDRDDRDDRDDDRRDRDRYDDDKRDRHRPTSGSKHDKKYESEEDRYNDRNNGQNKNGTEEENGDSKNRYDDKDRHSGSKKGDRDRHRNRDRDRYDDRDRYRPDYYDRFLRDRDYYDRPYYDDFRERRPLYDRYPERYDDGYGRYGGYRRGYEDRGHDDGYGGYGPGVGSGPHDRPWDETYRGASGWDAGGRGYYFASGRPDAAPASAWGRSEYARPQSESGWQNVGYAAGYRDPLEYRGSVGYSPTGYRQDLSSGYGQASGWQSVDRRPYRDESGVKKLDSRYYQTLDQNYAQTSRQPTYSQPQSQYTYGQHSQDDRSSKNQGYGQSSQGPYGQGTYGQHQNYQSSTTPATSYLYQREEERVTTKMEETTKNST